jgi:threonine dehydrogenase-like Zn-dependent dehydrogenase
MAGRNPQRLRAISAQDAAKDLGADDVYYMDDKNWATLDEKFDAAIVAAPPSLAADALSKVGYGGKVLVCGITLGEGGHADIDVNDMVLNKKQLLTHIAEPALNFPLSIRMIESAAIQAGRIITNTVVLEEAPQLKKLYAQDSPAIKTVMLCSKGQVNL